MKKYVGFILSLSFAAFAADGTLDTTTFNAPNGTFVSAFAQEAKANAVVVRHDGAIVVGGSVGTIASSDLGILILNANGTQLVARSEHIGGAGSQDIIFGLAVQPDNKVVAVGEIINADGTEDFFVARFCASGVLDTTFNAGGVIPGVQVIDFFNASIARGRAVALTSGGNIVAVGAAQNVPATIGAPVFYAAAMLDSSGALIPTFASGGRGVYANITPNPGVLNTSSEAFAVAIQSIAGSENIVFSGFGEQGALERFQIVRLTPIGGIDFSFNGNGVDQVIFAPALDELSNGVDIYPDGRIVAVGTSFNIATSNVVLTRRQVNGGADNSFGAAGLVTFNTTPVALITGDAVIIQNNGNILVAGDFDDGMATGFITERFLSSGALDTTFNSPTGYAVYSFTDGATANALALQGDGKIVVTGDVAVGAEIQMGVLRYLNNNAAAQVFVAPTITSPANTFANCSNNPPTLAGAAQNPSNITVYINGMESGRTITTGATNTWSFTPVAPLATGANTFQIVAEYKSGNMNVLSPLACCGIGLGPQSCISVAIRTKYCASCVDTPINVACS